MNFSTTVWSTSKFKKYCYARLRSICIVGPSPSVWRVMPLPSEASRAIASHLLDRGFNSNFLHRWWSYRLRIQAPADTPLTALVAEAADLANKTEQDYAVLVPFPSELKPPRDLLPPASWINAAAVSAWVHDNGLAIPVDLHQQGGLLLTFRALDAESAVQLAAERVELFAARVLLSVRKQIQNCGVAWVKDKPRSTHLA